MNTAAEYSCVFPDSNYSILTKPSRNMASRLSICGPNDVMEPVILNVNYRVSARRVVFTRRFKSEVLGCEPVHHDIR
jgi:hypothetical protein